MKLNGHDYEEHTLENGFTVHMLKTPHKRIRAEVQVQHGANHEEDDELGLAHYLEHVIAGGGGEKYSPEEVDELQDGFGDSNANTEGEKTSYVGTILTEQLSTFLKTTEDIVFHTPLRQEIIDRERESILREVAMHVGEPSYVDIEETYRAFYDQECFHRNPLGKEAVIENASQEQLANFLQRGYSPNNTQLLLVGGLPNNTKDIIEEIFGALPKGDGEKFIYPSMGALEKTVLIERPAPDLINQENNENSNAELVIFCQAPKQGDDEEIAMNITNKLLGGGWMSVMLRKLRIEHGLAYSAGSQYAAFPAGTMFAYSDVLAQEVNTAR
ncbi:insulinase family protein, partial [Candidatus Woesearchaeota archaeon]|nr:insulinase family protein [Candidatus Woesearchaeota archaeon]